MTFRRGVPMIAFLAALLAASAAGAGAAVKDFHFPDVRIEIAVSADGAFTVEEFRTFDFRGRFTWAAFWLPTRAEGPGGPRDLVVDDVAIADENGEPLRAAISRSTGRLEAKWYFEASNERRTFHFHYRVSRGIVRYPDVCELYWKAIGAGWDKRTDAATVTVRLPAPAADRSGLLVYGHGPLSGVSEILDAQTVRFHASAIPPRQFLEIRFLWPPGLTDGVPSGARTLETIRAEEARFVRETIDGQRKAIAEADRRAARMRRWIVLWLAGLVVIPLAWLAFFIPAWRRDGKDYRFDDISPYVHEPPSDLPPALMESLLKEGEAPTPRSFTATIFDLARKGFIEVEDVRVEKHGLFGPKASVDTNLTLRRDYRGDGALLPFEKAVLDCLFDLAWHEPAPGARITLEEFKKRLKGHPQDFQTWFQSWTKAVKAEAKARGFIEPASLHRRNVFLAVTVPLALLTLNVVLIVLAGLLIPTMKRRTMAWAREYEMWKGLKRFLDDFSEFKDLPPEAYELWERYLIAGMIFGNAKRILKTLPIVLRDERAASPVWYAGSGRSAFLQSGGIESMISHIDALSASITSAAHYSSGAGGGFSGGGGGGAGGGGGSAG